MTRDGISQREALLLMARKDRQRRSYHNQHCKRQWGEATTYDLTINSSRLGIDGTVDMLEHYILAREALEAST